MAVWRRVAVLGWALFLGLIAGPAALAESPFATWAVVIVSGDWHAHSGAPSEAFDNARRDLAKAFIAAGFSPANISQFSARPATGPAAAHGPPAARHGRKSAAGSGATTEPPPFEAKVDVIRGELDRLTGLATGGCLIYFTSHGNPGGVVVGATLLPPGDLGAMVDESCKDRPTVAIISACYSGVFVPDLDGPDRMVLTAARPDRSSFGCGESDRYTYFDGCVLQSLAQTHDFTAMATATQACVARREAETGASPPSEPQLEIGADLKLMLPLYAFAAPPPGSPTTVAAAP